MPKTGPTQEQIDELVDAMCCVLNDMGEDGLSVCAMVKAKARLAFAPFELDDNGDLMDIEKAREIIAACNY